MVTKDSRLTFRNSSVPPRRGKTRSRPRPVNATNSCCSPGVKLWGCKLAQEMFDNGAWNDAEDFHGPTDEYIIEWEGGSIGTNYCQANPNTTGASGTLSASGSASVAADDFTLTAESLPAQQFGIFITSLTPGFVPNAGGTSNGNLCLGGAIGRFFLPSQIKSTGTTGEFSLQLPLTMFPQGAGVVAVVPGETWFFQAWHREGAGAGSNFTDGLEVTFN